MEGAMVTILQECAIVWSVEGAVQVQTPSIEGEVRVSPDSARRRANSYLSLEVAMEFQPGEPVLVWQDQPVWRMPINLHLPSLGELAPLGTIDVDATTRTVIPLSATKIQQMRVRAHELLTRLTPPTAPTE